MTISEFFQRWLQLCQGDPGFAFISEIAFLGSLFLIAMLIDPVMYALDWIRRPFFPWKCDDCGTTAKDVTWRNNTFMCTMSKFGFDLPPTPWRRGHRINFYCDACQEKAFRKRYPNWDKPPAMPKFYAALNKNGLMDEIEDEMRRGKGAY